MVYIHSFSVWFGQFVIIKQKNLTKLQQFSCDLASQATKQQQRASPELSQFLSLILASSQWSQDSQLSGSYTCSQKQF